LVFRDVKVPKENIVGEVNGAYAVFNTMMIPERLGTAAMTLGPARAALDIATQYSSRRKAFGQVINRFQGVSFQVAEGAMLLDAHRRPSQPRQRGCSNPPAKAISARSPLSARRR
jgi:alkylation response protein AidB-like acyl-CoA dehydrogenase